MFNEDKVQPCRDCGKKYILENLMTGKSWEWWLCIRCYNGRRNEKKKNAEAKAREREGAIRQDRAAGPADQRTIAHPNSLGSSSQHYVETVREKGNGAWTIK